MADDVTKSSSSGDVLGSLATGVASSGANAILSAGMSALTGSGSAHYQRRNFRENTHYANRLAIENAKNKYSYEVEALQKAGISLASLGGSFQNAGVTGVSTGDAPAPNMQANIPAVSQSAEQISQAQTNQAQARLLNAEAGIKETEGTFTEQFWQNKIAEGANNIKYLEQITGLTEQEKFKVLTEVDWLNYTYFDRAAEIRANVDYIKQQKASLGIKTDLDLSKYPIEIQLMHNQIFKSYNDGMLSKAQTAQAYGVAEYLGYVSQILSDDIKARHFNGSFELECALHKWKTYNDAMLEYNKKYNLPNIYELNDKEIEQQRAEILTNLERLSEDLYKAQNWNNSNELWKYYITGVSQLSGAVGLSTFLGGTGSMGVVKSASKIRSFNEFKGTTRNIGTPSTITNYNMDKTGWKAYHRQTRQ